MRRSGAFVYRLLETIFPLFFIPPLPYPARSARHLPHAGKAVCRGYRFPHPTSAPSGHLLPEEGAAERGEAGLASFFAAKPPPLCLPHRGRGTASAVDRVLSQTAYLRRSSSLFFIPLVPYPARSARHLPHAGKALSVVAMISCKDGAAYKSPGIPAPISPVHVRGLHRRF